MKHQYICSPWTDLGWEKLIPLRQRESMINWERMHLEGCGSGWGRCACRVIHRQGLNHSHPLGASKLAFCASKAPRLRANAKRASNFFALPRTESSSDEGRRCPAHAFDFLRHASLDNQIFRFRTARGNSESY